MTSARGGNKSLFLWRNAQLAWWASDTVAAWCQLSPKVNTWLLPCICTPGFTEPLNACVRKRPPGDISMCVIAQPIIRGWGWRGRGEGWRVLRKVMASLTKKKKEMKIVRADAERQRGKRKHCDCGGKRSLKEWLRSGSVFCKVHYLLAGVIVELFNTWLYSSLCFQYTLPGFRPAWKLKPLLVSIGNPQQPIPSWPRMCLINASGALSQKSVRSHKSHLHQSLNNLIV